MFYEHDDEYIPLRIILKDVVGYSSKSMNFRISDDDGLIIKFYDIFGHIRLKLGIDLNDFTYKSNGGEEYLKTSVSDETCFRENKDNRIANKNIKYTYRVLLQIQSVYFSMKDNKDDIKYYPHV